MNQMGSFNNKPEITFMSLTQLSKAAALVLLIILALIMHNAHADEIKIVAFGTSFTAGTGTHFSSAFPVKLEKILRSQGESVRIYNAGVAGDTTRQLIDRLESAVPDGTQIVIFEPAFGNDHDARIEKSETFRNCDQVISKLVERKIQVLLVTRGKNKEMLERVSNRFANMTSKYGILYFGLVQDPSTLAPDGQHPSAKEHLLIAERMAPQVKIMIEKARALESAKLTK